MLKYLCVLSGAWLGVWGDETERCPHSHADSVILGLNPPPSMNTKTCTTPTRTSQKSFQLFTLASMAYDLQSSGFVVDLRNGGF